MEERNFRNTFAGSVSQTFVRAIRLVMHQYTSPGPKATNLAIFDPSDEDGAQATISIGGHPLPQHVLRSGEATGVGRHGTLLGVAEKVDLHDDVVRLRSGEALVLFTDGIVGKREAGEGSVALRSALRDGPPSTAAELRDRLERYVRVEVGGDQLDDVAVLVLMAR